MSNSNEEFKQLASWFHQRGVPPNNAVISCVTLIASVITISSHDKNDVDNKIQMLAHMLNTTATAFWEAKEAGKLNYPTS